MKDFKHLRRFDVAVLDPWAFQMPAGLEQDDIGALALLPTNVGELGLFFYPLCSDDEGAATKTATVLALLHLTGFCCREARM